jgi:hypothetical protein
MLPPSFVDKRVQVAYQKKYGEKIFVAFGFSTDVTYKVWEGAKRVDKLRLSISGYRIWTVCVVSSSYILTTMWSILISTSLRLETFEAINYMRSVNICWRFLIIVVLWYIVALLSFGRSHGENKGYRWAQAALLRLIQAFWQLTQGRASYILAFEAPSTRLRAKIIAIAQVVMCCILLVTSPLGLYLLDPGALNAGAKTEPFRNFFMQVFRLSLAATLSCQRWKSALLKSFANTYQTI